MINTNWSNAAQTEGAIGALVNKPGQPVSDPVGCECIRNGASTFNRECYAAHEFALRNNPKVGRGYKKLIDWANAIWGEKKAKYLARNVFLYDMDEAYTLLISIALADSCERIVGSDGDVEAESIVAAKCFLAEFNNCVTHLIAHLFSVNPE